MNITNNKTPNNNYKVRASYYNYEKDKENELDYIGNSSSPTNINITTDTSMGDYLPCVAIEYSGNLYDSKENTTGGISICDDFSCNFRVNTTCGGYLVPDESITSSGFISCNINPNIKLKGITFNLDSLTENLGLYRIFFYGENKEYIGYISSNIFNNTNNYIEFSYSAKDNTTTIKIISDQVKYIRFCCNSMGISYDSSIEVDGRKFKCKDGYLKDRIYIKSQYIKDLEENIQQLSNQITALENLVEE